MKPLESLSDDELARALRRAAAWPDAPAVQVQAAIALWPGPVAAASSDSGVADVARAAVRLIQAVLSFDSAAQPAIALGMRSADAATRHLLYSAQGRDIDLRLSSNAGSYALSGQILGPDEAGVVELDGQAGPDADAPAYRAALDELGAFRLDGVPRGTYRLTLRMGADCIVLPPLEVGAAA